MVIAKHTDETSRPVLIEYVAISRSGLSLAWVCETYLCTCVGAATHGHCCHAWVTKHKTIFKLVPHRRKTVHGNRLREPGKESRVAHSTFLVRWKLFLSTFLNTYHYMLHAKWSGHKWCLKRQSEDVNRPSLATPPASSPHTNLSTLDLVPSKVWQCRLHYSITTSGNYMYLRLH